VDVRRLQVLQLPLDEQTVYAETFRHLSSLQELLTQAGSLGVGLIDDVRDRLAAGGLTT
jgi:hypothetical protein